ncbi:MAG TPA: hypothetical protein VNO70_17955 [Blastocatellia bacterium]|nr:hypothetical protein [Blastocatellia bacterium]
MTLAAILFAIAALGGVALAVIRFTGKDVPPTGLALAHGAVAAAGLVALIIAVTGGAASSRATIALAGFIIAALGGFLLFSYHLRRQALPIPLVAIHGLVAVVSFAILLFGIFAA